MKHCSRFAHVDDAGERLLSLAGDLRVLFPDYVEHQLEQLVVGVVTIEVRPG